MVSFTPYSRLFRFAIRLLVLLSLFIPACAPPDKVMDEDNKRPWPAPPVQGCVDWRTANYARADMVWTIDPDNPCRLQGDRIGKTGFYSDISVLAPVSGAYVYVEGNGDWAGRGNAMIQLWEGDQNLVSERSFAVIGNGRFTATTDFWRVKPGVTSVRVVVRIYAAEPDRFKFRLDASGLLIKPVTDLEAKTLAPRLGRAIVNGRPLGVTDPDPALAPE